MLTKNKALTSCKITGNKIISFVQDHDGSAEFSASLQIRINNKEAINELKKRMDYISARNNNSDEMKESSKNFHITLQLFYPTINQIEKVNKIVQSILKKYEKITINITKDNSLFGHDDFKYPVVIVDSNTLHKIRDEFRHHLEINNIKYQQNNYDYKPHVSLFLVASKIIQASLNKCPVVTVKFSEQLEISHKNHVGQIISLNQADFEELEKVTGEKQKVLFMENSQLPLDKRYIENPAMSAYLSRFLKTNKLFETEEDIGILNKVADELCIKFQTDVDMEKVILKLPEAYFNKMQVSPEDFIKIPDKWLNTTWVEILITWNKNEFVPPKNIQEGMCTIQSYENFNLVKSTLSHLDAEELEAELLLLTQGERISYQEYVLKVLTTHHNNKEFSELLKVAVKKGHLTEKVCEALNVKEEGYKEVCVKIHDYAYNNRKNIPQSIFKSFEGKVDMASIKQPVIEQLNNLNQALKDFKKAFRGWSVFGPVPTEVTELLKLCKESLLWLKNAKVVEDIYLHQYYIANRLYKILEEQVSKGVLIKNVLVENTLGGVIKRPLANLLNVDPNVFEGFNTYDKRDGEVLIGPSQKVLANASGYEFLFVLFKDKLDEFAGTKGIASEVKNGNDLSMVNSKK